MPNIQLVAIHCDSGPSSLWRPGSLVAAFFTNVPWENRGAWGDFTLPQGGFGTTGDGAAQVAAAGAEDDSAPVPRPG